MTLNKKQIFWERAVKDYYSKSFIFWNQVSSKQEYKFPSY